MTNTQGDIYQHHHQAHREPGFSILKDERGRLLKELIGTGKRILDIGCRDGALTKFFVLGNQVLGVDVDEQALHEAGKLGIETLKVDLHGSWDELKGKTFDVVVAGEVLEHLYFPDLIVEKVSKILAPQGVFIGSVPNAFSLKNRLRYLLGTKRHTPLVDPTHINHFQAQELKELLEKYFSQVELRGLGRYARLAKFSPNFFAFDLFFIARL